MLAQPVPLAEAVALDDGLGGLAIAVYRTDSACVPTIEFSPMPSGEQEASRFAYVDAPEIQVRRLEAVNAGLSPPISGFHISQSYWTHWESEWAAAQLDGVLIEAVVVYVPDDRQAPAEADPRVASVVEVTDRRTDSLDPGYPGELFIDDDRAVVTALSPIEDPACEPAG